MKFLKLLVAALLFAVMAMQGASAADPAPDKPAEAGSFFESMDGAVREIARKANSDLSATMKDTGYRVAATLSDKAVGIAGGLALIYLFYEVMQFLSGRTKSMLVILFDVGIPCIFAALFITQYAILLPKFETVLDVFRNLGGSMGAGGGSPFEGILSVYGTVFGNITTGIKNAFSAGLTVVQFVKDPAKFFVNWLDLFATILFSLGILVLLLIGVAEVLGLLLIGPFLFGVGVAFGPVMIAGLVTPWTRDYFTKWLQFLVISAGLTGVINVIFTIAYQLMKDAQVGQSESQMTAVSLLIIAILLLTINSMVSQAPSIASALFPGHVGVAKSSGAAVKEAASKAGSGFKTGSVGGAKGVVATVKGGVGGGKLAGRFAKSLMPPKP